MQVFGKSYRTVWFEAPTLYLIDQRRLPFAFEVVASQAYTDTALAIRNMTVRGAGAIGATGAFGMAQVFLSARPAHFEADLQQGAQLLRETRPTAQNLFYGINTVLEAGLHSLEQGIEPARAAAIQAAQAVADEDAACCHQIGLHGAQLIPDGARVSTHCNAGWLAFVDWGSALAPIYQARREGKHVSVLVDETRPRGQGARLTAWELGQEQVPHQLLTDGVAAFLMARGEVDLVIVGADRIAANGDVANKIGTYASALAAREAGIPFYVAAPSTTIDPQCPSGKHIPIEERSDEEVLFVDGKLASGELARVRIAPEGTRGRNPAFDVTPAQLVRGIITETGVYPASSDGIAQILYAREKASRKAECVRASPVDSAGEL